LRLPDVIERYPEAVPKFTLLTLLESTSKSRLGSSGVMFANRSRVLELLPQLDERRTAMDKKRMDTLMPTDFNLKGGSSWNRNVCS
jgi:hypothetical protein